MSITRREYARGTYVDQSSPWGAFTGGRALCADGKVRRLKRIASTTDTFYSIPAAVEVRRDGRRQTVSGFVTTQTIGGCSTECESDPAVLKFIAYEYEKNKNALPRGSWREDAEGNHVQP
jgi:hypothetical protein